MDVHDSVDAPVFGSLSSSESLEKVHLGMGNSPIHKTKPDELGRFGTDRRLIVRCTKPVQNGVGLSWP